MLYDLRTLSKTARNAAKQMAGKRSAERVLRDCRHLLTVRAEANSLPTARSIALALADFDETTFEHWFDALAQEFSPDPIAVLAAARAYADNPQATQLAALAAASEPPRQELFRRLNRAPGGTAAIVHLRRHLLKHLDRKPEWQAIENDLLHLLSSWFNPGFLEMRRVDWSSPARLLEQIIQHEAVHAIDGWDDLRRRLQPDRRCFAFFHPQLSEVPLIFVEVALLPSMPDAIAPLIDKSSKVMSPKQFRVATFYSISNCEPGLRRVSLGDFLIKRVADELKRELPQLKTFCTLSPIPGFMSWLKQQGASIAIDDLKPSAAKRLNSALTAVRAATGDDVRLLSDAGTLASLGHAELESLQALASYYLVHESPKQSGDPVARFHLDNGARLERVNARADLSAKGLKQSAGMMVNYLYDLDRIEQSHEDFVNGSVTRAKRVGALIE